MKKEKKTNRINLRIEPELFEKLKYYSKKQNQKTARIIRDTIRNLIDNNPL